MSTWLLNSFPLDWSGEITNNARRDDRLDLW